MQLQTKFRVLIPTLICLFAYALPGKTMARGGWRVLAAEAGQVRVDGDLREWPREAFESRAQRLRIAFGADIDGLLIAVAVRDEALVVGKRNSSEAHDAVVVDLMLPRAGRVQKPIRLWLHPGRPGEVPARVRSPGHSRLAGQVKLIDGPNSKGGYVLEAHIPWQDLPGAENRHLAQVAVALHDVDREGARPKPPPPQANELRDLLVAGNQAPGLAQLLAEHDLQASRKWLSELTDVCGDTRLEQVLVIGNVIVVRSADVGLKFFILPVTSAGQVRGAGLDLDSKHSWPALVVTLARPGAAELAVRYQWDGDRFVVGQTILRDEEPKSVRAAARPQKVVKVAPVARVAPVSQTPSVPELLAAFRRQRGYGSELRVRFELQENIAEDARPETIMMLGRDLFVAGPGFRQGRGFFFATLPVQASDSVRSIEVADVTGDGRGNLLIRSVQQIGEPGGVVRELLHVYGFFGGSFTRHLVAEVGRRAVAKPWATGQITNRIRILRGPGVGLCIEPGIMEGWTAATYPFAGQSPAGQAPLLLPFRDKTVCYRLDGSLLAPQAANK